jgi:hypothetical protein
VAKQFNIEGRGDAAKAAEHVAAIQSFITEHSNSAALAAASASGDEITAAASPARP